MVSAEDQTTGTISVTSVPGLLFAAPGKVDGGAGGTNSLVFADSDNRGLTTSVAAGTYLNFTRLTVTGGTWELSGGSLLPTGSSITLNGGALGSGGLTLDGTMVSGVGTLNQLNVGSGATLSPGNTTTPFGRLDISGNLNLLRGSSYRVAATADGQHSSVNVSGIANLAGSVLHMGQNGTYAPSTTYTILTAGGGVRGQFDDISSNLAFLTPSLAYCSNQVDLTVKLKQVPGGDGDGDGDGDGGTRPIEFADAAVTSNQRSVAQALQTLPDGAPPGVFDGLSGEAHATSVTVAQSTARNFIQLPMSRLCANLAAGMLPGAPTAQLGLGSAAALPRSAAQPLWAQVYGNWGSLSGNGNAARTTQRDSGLSIGADVAVGSGWRLGGAVCYSNSRANTHDRASNSRADNYSLTVYGGKAFDAGNAKLNLSLGVSYTWHKIKTKRYADAAGLPQTLKASYDGHTTQLFGELGYAMPLNDRVTLEPFIGADF